jgi:ferredoxin-NADP reductase
MNQSGKKIKELEVMVTETVHEAPDAVTLVLFTGNDQLTYQPGHFLTIEPQQFKALERRVAYLEDVKGKKERPRAYSLSSSPDEKYLAVTVKEERYISGVTPYPPLLSPILARRTEPGTRMVITGFTGPYTLSDKIREESDEIVHICAGSGIVPSYSIIKHDLRMNAELKHTLVYSNKRREDVIFYEQLDELQKEFSDRLRIIHTLTRETDESLFNANVLKGSSQRRHTEASDSSAGANHGFCLRFGSQRL